MTLRVIGNVHEKPSQSCWHLLASYGALLRKVFGGKGSDPRGT
jgi:hypothetical protein